jgi:hypothetical protein
MSKKLSYKGKIDIGEQDRIKLATIDGKTGYKINKFHIIGTSPGTATFEYIAQIFKTDQTGSISGTVDFTNSDLLAVAYYEDFGGSGGSGNVNTVIFDNEKFNQDIFINITDASGGTTPCNYYIELEAVPLTDLEATMLTLKSIRSITS